MWGPLMWTLPKFRMFRIILNINSISYSFWSIANRSGVRYSDSTSYFKKYSSSKCKQTVCLHTDLTSTLRLAVYPFYFQSTLRTYSILCSRYKIANELALPVQHLFSHYGIMQWIWRGVNLKCIDAYAVLEWENDAKFHVFVTKYKANT
jgi:hypothetical protein